MWTLTLLFTMSGCGWFGGGKGLLSDPDSEYDRAQEGPDLVIPEDLDSSEIGDPWPIPEIPEPVRSVLYTKDAPRPEALYASDAKQEVKIQRIGERRWLVLPEPPTMVWPKVKQFFADNGIGVETERPSAGRLNSEWLAITDQNYRDVIRLLLRDTREAAKIEVGKDRMLVRIEQGIRPRTSEVHVRHENDSLRLPSSPALDDLGLVSSAILAAENEMLNELGAYVAAKVSEASISMVAQNIATQSKTRLDRMPNGDPILLLFLDFERAWATIGQALENADVEVTDINQDNGDYFIAVPESILSGEERGFFSRMWGGKGSLDLRLHVDPRDTGVGVSVAAEEDEKLDEDLSQQVLLLIREFAS